MIEDRCHIETRDGRMDSFITHPRQGGPFPVVLFYMDSLGVREELRDMARRVAAAGYYVVLPNLYYRRAQPPMKARDERRLDNPVHDDQQLNIERVMRDTAAMLAHVDA